jgi:hypothetical protein
VRDLLFPKLPAQQQDFSLDAAGKIKQANVNVLDLHAGSVDFGDRVLGALNGALTFGFAPSHGDHVNQGPAVQKDAVRHLLRLRIDRFDQFFAADGSAQQRFQGGQQHLRILQGECTSGHFTYSNLSLSTRSNPLVPTPMSPTVRASVLKALRPAPRAGAMPREASTSWFSLTTPKFLDG